MGWKEWFFKKETTLKQSGVQWEALCRLQRNGSITALEVQTLGTTCAHKLIKRLKDAGHISHFTVEPNASGQGYHHRHHWSRKLIVGCHSACNIDPLSRGIGVQN